MCKPMIYHFLSAPRNWKTPILGSHRTSFLGIWWRRGTSSSLLFLFRTTGEAGCKLAKHLLIGNIYETTSTLLFTSKGVAALCHVVHGIVLMKSPMCGNWASKAGWRGWSLRWMFHTCVQSYMRKTSTLLFTSKGVAALCHVVHGIVMKLISPTSSILSTQACPP